MGKIKLSRSEGKITYIVPLFWVLFFLVLVVYYIQIHLYEAISTYTEDALAASSLASAVIDIQEYGITHEIIVESPDYAYEIYQKALKINMGLDANWMRENLDPISGKVEVLDYIVYNVNGRDVYVYRYGESQSEMYIADGLGSVAAPNGQLIESTSIYSRITFPVDGAFGIRTIAEKQLLVDIVNNF